MANTVVSTSIYPFNAPFGFNPIQADPPVSTSGIAAGTPAGQGIATNQGPTQAVGTIVDTSIGALMYGCAAATLTVGYLHYFPNDATYGFYTGTLLPATASVSALGPQIVGTPLVALTAGQFGWFWIGGGVWNLYVQNSVTTLSPLTATSTAGQAGTGGVKFGASNFDTTTSGASTRVLAPTIMMVNQAFT